jgi:hypothetical protein
MQTARNSHISLAFIVIIDALGYQKHKPVKLVSESRVFCEIRRYYAMWKTPFHLT